MGRYLILSFYVLLMLSASGAPSIGQTNIVPNLIVLTNSFVKEETVENGLTLGGVRLTAWPAGTGDLIAANGMTNLAPLLGAGGVAVQATNAAGFMAAIGAAPLASPAMTGNPTVPTATPGDNDTTAASTAFVTAAVTAGGGGDTIWTNIPSGTDMEGGSIYGYSLLNPLSPYLFNIVVNHETNQWGRPSPIFMFGATEDAIPFDIMQVAVSNAFVYAMGGIVLSDSQWDGVNYDIFMIGDSAGAGTTFRRTADAYGFGPSPFGFSTLTDSLYLVSIGSGMNLGSFENCQSIYALGEDTLRQAFLTNSSDIYAFGKSSGLGLTGTGKSHIFLVGSGARATNSNSWVAGDTNYNYLFPGASMTISGPITNHNLTASRLMVSSAAKVQTSVSTTGLVDGTGSAVTVGSGLDLTGGTLTATGGGGGVAMTVSNNVASAGLLAVDSTKTNGIAATAAHVTNALGMNLQGQLDLKAPLDSPTFTTFADFPAGSASVPSIGWAADHDGSGTGFFRGAADKIAIAIAGNQRFDIGAGTFNITLASGSFLINGDTTLSRDGAANVWQSGSDSASALGQVFKGPDGSGTDKVGGSLTVEGGQSTGTAASGAVIVKTANSAGASGSTANAYSERFHAIPKWVTLTESADTILFTVPVPATNYVGLTATVTVYATDGTDHQSLTTPITVDAVAKTTTITTVVAPTAAQTAVAASSGTLSVTYTVADAGSNVLNVRCNAVSSLTQTVLRAKIVITAINSNGTATITEQ